MSIGAGRKEGKGGERRVREAETEGEREETRTGEGKGNDRIKEVGGACECVYMCVREATAVRKEGI